MRKYVFDNAVVYITKPTDAQKENIRKSTEKFVMKLAKEGLIRNEQGRNNNRTSRTSANARKRTKQVKSKSTPN
jgi:hypothetical protein